MSTYAESYLMDAMENLGEMADYARQAFGVGLETFWNMFVVTGVAREFEAGSPRVIAGMSGIELALRAAEQLDLKPIEEPYTAGELVDLWAQGSAPKIDYGPSAPSPEYWCGWVLAYYQWASGRSFSNINKFLTINDVLCMYPTFHQQAEERFAEAADQRAGAVTRESRLREFRKISGLSQSQLAQASGVGLRAIQQYEQGAKDINKAAAGAVQSLSRVLHCTPEDLLEPLAQLEYAIIDFGRGLE